MQSPAKHKVVISEWKRKEHYQFFKQFEQPFFGITAELNCTKAYRYCKAYGVPFFLFYLHKSLCAVNQVRELRYRAEGEEVFEYESISGSVTVLRADETFGFAYFDYNPGFTEFAEETKKAVNAEKLAKGLRLDFTLSSLIHYSVLPGISFTSLTHAQLLSAGDSVPKIVFGKLAFRGGQVFLPLSVHVHHGLCDGLHVTRFLDVYQKYLELEY